MVKLLLVFALFFFLGYGILSFVTKYLRTNSKPPQNNGSQPQQEEKHFSKNVGEYVSYEEVKEENKKTDNN